MRLVNKRVIIILGVFLIIGIGVWFSLSHKNAGNKSVGNSTYTDPYSHETVSSPAGKTPDTYGAPNNQPLYLGIDKLLNYGVTLDQLNETKQAFYSFSLKQPQPIKQVSVDVDHITTQHDPTVHKSPFTILFNVQIDQKNIYQAMLIYTGLNDIQLQLRSSGSIIFDSGVITPRE